MASSRRLKLDQLLLNLALSARVPELIRGAGASLWLCLCLAEPIRRVLGSTRINLATRLPGLISAAVAIEFIIGGLVHLFPALGIPYADSKNSQEFSCSARISRFLFGLLRGPRKGAAFSENGPFSRVATRCAGFRAFSWNLVRLAWHGPFPFGRAAGRTFRGCSGGQGQNRTADTRIFSPLLYRLSYLPVTNLDGAVRPSAGRRAGFLIAYRS